METKKVISFQVDKEIYTALRCWADLNDTDVSKVCRAAIRDFMEKEDIVAEEAQGGDWLAKKLANAGISLEDLE